MIGVRRPEAGVEAVHCGIWVIAASEFVEHIHGEYAIFHGGDVGSTIRGGLGLDATDLLLGGHEMGVLGEEMVCDVLAEAFF